MVSTHDASTADRPTHDASTADRAKDATTASDAKQDGAADAAPACPGPVTASTCAADASATWGRCQPTWAEVLAAPPQCIPFHVDGLDEKRGTCGGYNVDSFNGVDWIVLYYYDMGTGQLVATYDIGGPGIRTCRAGPSEGVPGCTFTGVDLCQKDAGIDARD